MIGQFVENVQSQVEGPEGAAGSLGVKRALVGMVVLGWGVMWAL